MPLVTRGGATELVYAGNLLEADLARLSPPDLLAVAIELRREYWLMQRVRADLSIANADLHRRLAAIRSAVIAAGEPAPQPVDSVDPREGS